MSAIVVCSKCKEDFNNCKCDLFQPNEVILTDAEPFRLTFGSSVNHYLVIKREEAEELYRFFMECGYISYEHYPRIHEFIDKKLVPFVKETGK